MWLRNPPPKKRTLLTCDWKFGRGDGCGKYSGKDCEFPPMEKTDTYLKQQHSLPTQLSAPFCVLILFLLSSNHSLRQNQHFIPANTVEGQSHTHRHSLTAEV